MTHEDITCNVPPFDPEKDCLTHWPLGDFNKILEK